MGMLKKRFPRGRWVERRWVRDGGIGNGNGNGKAMEKEGEGGNGRGKGKGTLWTSGKSDLKPPCLQRTVTLHLYVLSGGCVSLNA